MAVARGDLNGGFACLQLISRALEKVKRERQEELKALREARQAQQAKHAAKQGPKPGEKQCQDRPAPGAEPSQQDKSQQQSRKRKHEHEHEHKLPPSGGPEAQQKASQQGAPAKTEPPRKAESLPGAAAAVEKQQRILSADGLPEAVRLEAAAQLMAPAAAADRGAHRAGPAAEDSKAKPAGKGAKAGSGQKRKRQLVNDSSDDEAAPDASRAAPHAEPAAAEKGVQQHQATPAKAVQRAKSTTPASASRAPDEDGAGPNAEESVEKEQRKMREALEKVCFRTCFRSPCTTCHPASCDDLTVRDAQRRCLEMATRPDQTFVYSILVACSPAFAS